MELLLIVVSVVILLALTVLLMWPVGSRYCPFCGAEYVHWTATAKDRGYVEERRWHGCPQYRDGDYEHGASFERMKRTSRYDPATGQPREVG